VSVFHRSWFDSPPAPGLSQLTRRSFGNYWTVEQVSDSTKLFFL
jgi:hypothetical protein